MVQVESIIFNGLRATGVRVVGRAGGQVSVHANKEIILCSGAYGSAKLLLLRYALSLTTSD
jgi:choline dehydrogenase-like flavoprotein